MLLDVGPVNDDLHKGHFTDEGILLVVDVLDSSDDDIELMKLVAHGHSALDGDIQVVDSPSPQVFHAKFLVFVMVDKGFQLGPLVKQILPVLKLILSGNDQERSVNLVHELEVLEEVDDGDALA